MSEWRAEGLLFHFFHQENLGGEVVAIAIEPHARSMGAQGVALVLPGAVAQEIAVEHLGAQEGELWLLGRVGVACEILRHQNLVK